MFRRGLALAILLVAGGSAWTQNLNTPARELFGGVDNPAPLATHAIGGYARGCLAGGVALPTDGPNWQAMRLSRNRFWGHPTLVAYLERLATDAARLDGWTGLLIGDMAQPRGGPMRTGHASHQTGLDADLWYIPMPPQRLTDAERDSLSAISLLRPGTLEVDPARWDPRIGALLQRAASYPEVARIFVHPGIKQVLCQTAQGNRDWLRVIRPWYGHADHFHVRLDCPVADATCIPQAPPPEGDGCGDELAYWLGPEPYRPADPPPPPTPPLTLADLPAACSAVLSAGTPVTTTIPPFVPMPRPQ